MRILRFEISGKNAFFRNNEVNEKDITYSFGQIHKVALLGILGAIIGLGGHNKSFYDKTNGINKDIVHPEFYSKLKNANVSIIPNSEEGFFQRKKYNMVNTCGYSINKSTKKGQTLMYTEQWIEEPSWTIYLDLSLVEKEVAEKIEDYILNNKSVYIPYLGKTNHIAIIDKQEIVKGERLLDLEDIKIDSLFVKDEKVEILMPSVLDDDIFFEYREFLPVSYYDSNCQYNKKLLVYTNKNCNIKKEKVIRVENKNLIFI